MSGAQRLTDDCPPATDGQIAVINLNSTRQRSWSRFWQDPRRTGVAEAIVEQEQLTVHYSGDFGALDRLLVLARALTQADPASGRAALVNAQVASVRHCFAQARDHLARAI